MVGGQFLRLPDLVGEAGDRLGMRSKPSGSVSSLMVATAGGKVKRYDFDVSTEKWTQIAEFVETTYGPNLMALAAAPGASSFAVTTSTESQIYALQG
jgi:hypothetical protein